jgi:hypothetical protein
MAPLDYSACNRLVGMRAYKSEPLRATASSWHGDTARARRTRALSRGGIFRLSRRLQGKPHNLDVAYQDTGLSDQQP